MNEIGLLRGDIIQVTKENDPWRGCILMVDEPKSFGCQAFVKIPGRGEAYIRLEWGEFEKVGNAVLVPEGD